MLKTTMNKSPRKIVIIGEVGSGKTWLWQSYFQNRKPTVYTQTIFDNYCSSLLVDGKEVPFTLFDTCGEDDYSQLRQLIYGGANVIIFCVEIDNPNIYLSKSKSSCVDKWAQELKQYGKGTPILLVGTKKDIRDNADTLLDLAEKKIKPLKTKDLASISKKIKAQMVVECSAKTGEGLNIVFQNAIKLSLKSLILKR